MGAQCAARVPHNQRRHHRHDATTSGGETSTRSGGLCLWSPRNPGVLDNTCAAHGSRDFSVSRSLPLSRYERWQSQSPSGVPDRPCHGLGPWPSWPSNRGSIPRPTIPSLAHRGGTNSLTLARHQAYGLRASGHDAWGTMRRKPTGHHNRPMPPSPARSAVPRTRGG